jgi:uncharacterized protein (TIGR04255 family)
LSPLKLPPPDETRLSRSPLEVVICQIRFEAHPEVSEGEFAREFHEALGGDQGRYPKIDTLEEQQVGVTIVPTAETPSLESSTKRGWRMTSADDSWVVTLSPDHVSLETSAYTTWAGDFEDRLNALVDVVAQQLKPTFVQRLGLRYVDRIKELELKSVQDWGSYIRPELLGVISHPELGEAVKAAQSLVVFELDGGAGCNLRHGPLPPDKERVDYLLDYDIFRQGGRAFDPDAIKKEAGEFNHWALQLFQASLEDALLDKLK